MIHLYGISITCESQWSKKDIGSGQKAMSQSKREQVVSHLRYIRQELREMHQGIIEDGLLPGPDEIRGVMSQMEAVVELLEGKGSRKNKDSDS